MIETTSPVLPIQLGPEIAPRSTGKPGIDAPAQASGAKLPYECAKCHTRWGGLNTSHCSACHITTTGITAFDAHRTGSHTATGEAIIDKGKTEPRGPRRCLPPESVGLVDAGRAYPCWGLPNDGRDWASVLDSDGAA